MWRSEESRKVIRLAINTQTQVCTFLLINLKLQRNQTFMKITFRSGQYWGPQWSPKAKFWEHGDFFLQIIGISSKSTIARKNKKYLIALFMPQYFFFYRIWPQVNNFGSRCHQMKNYHFHGDGFSWIIPLIWGTWKNDTVALASPSRFGEDFQLFLPWKSISKFDLRSGQVKIRSRSTVMTKIGKYAYLLKWFDQLSRLVPFARLYFNHITSYWRKTDCDVIWHQVTSP